MDLREAAELLKEAPTYGWSDEMVAALETAKATLLFMAIKSEDKEN